MPLTRYLALAALHQLQPDTRLELDNDTYVIRQDDRYIAYRTWMAILPMIELFALGEEPELLSWQEKFGYSFQPDPQDLARISQEQLLDKLVKFSL
jgi:hypothetical protein